MINSPKIISIINNACFLNLITKKIVTVGSVAAGTDPAGTAPFIATRDAAGSAAYNVLLKAAIIKAIGANPGGVISTIVLPLAQASNAQYNFANTVYFKDFAIS